ncbi:MAG: hypothetical protein II717_06480, partial [Lachnospiraceae bacterium]|nr:hypothetical protein [Lachnospiraceae bacterium]
MKTKINEIPLVGPRGRKELLKRIEELEKGGNSNKKTKITVKVYAKKWDADNDGFVNESGVSGVLIVKGFTE